MSEQSLPDQDKSDIGNRRGLQGYVGATRELREACAGLIPGQMVCSASTSLMDSMAALQIMDPRMDSGIYPIPPHLIADCDKFPQMNNVTMPPFDPSARLSATEICWIMDRLLACEVDWHKGASLSQTIHTCLYVHSLSSISPRASQVKGESPNLLVCRVLRPFLMALLKSVGLVWDEVSKGNLIDGEDFNCDKGRISLLEEISLNEVEAWLGDAISYIQALGDSRYHSHYSSCDILTSDEAEALLIRIQLRGSFLRCTSIFSKVDPTLKLGEGLDPMQVLLDLPSALQESMMALEKLDEKALNHNTVKLSLMSPSFSHAPSIKATSVFDPAYSRHPCHIDTYNAPSAPPPPPLPLKGPEETIASIRGLLTGLEEAMHLANGNVCWSSWKSFFDEKAMKFQRENPFAYIRSLWQSVVCSDGVIGLRFTLDWIVDSFLNQEMESSKRMLLQLALNHQAIQSKDREAIISLQRRMDWFLEKLAGQLVNHLCSLAQNRSRGRRRLAESYETLVELSTETAAIEDSLQEVLGSQMEQLPFSPLNVQVLTLDTMLHIVFSGFELDLYRMEECVAVYWVAHRIAEEKVMVLEMMQKARSNQVDEIDDQLQSQLCFTKALMEASRAMETLFETRPIVRQSGLPWQTNAEDESVLQGQRIQQQYRRSAEKIGRTLNELDKVSFCKRFKWLRGKGRPEAMQTLDTLWNDLQAERQAIGVKSKRERLDWSAQCLDAAVASLNQIPAHLNNTTLKNSLQDISLACKSDDNITTQANASCLISLTFSHTTLHPWFPVHFTQQQSF